MIIHIAPDAPLLVRAAASAVLYTHIAGATVGLVSGTVSILARKGGTVHRTAGNVFFGSMLAMAGAGAIAAPLLPDRFTAVMSWFVLYLVLTSWWAVRRPPGEIGRFERLALLMPLGVAAADFLFAWIGSQMPHGRLDGLPAQMGWFFGSLALLAFVVDLSVIRRGGLSGFPRIRRHLWRMSLALAITWGSFAGQPRAQPEAIRGSPALFLPALGVLALMVYWLVRQRARRPARRVAVAA